MSILVQAFKKGVSLVTNRLLQKQNETVTQLVQQQTRNLGYINRMMLKDIKRREMLRKYAPERVRLQCLRRNDVLPKALKQSAEEQLQNLSNHSSLKFINDRCGITSKPGGVLSRWRLSRIMWRLIADYNHMSGVTRARWGWTDRNSICFRFRPNKRDWFNTEGYTRRPYIDSNNIKRTMLFRHVGYQPPYY